jgi:NitT/TauT family transport system ATP-binding protein
MISILEPAQGQHTAQASGGVSLRIDRVSKTFADGQQAVEALRPTTLDIDAGEFVCLLGPSGCGKSTLLSIVAGLETPTGGTVWAGDCEVRNPGPDRVLMFQDAALFPWLDVRRNIEFGLRQTKIPATERNTIVDRLIAMVHLGGFERSSIHQLSGGMRQRVALARALAINPAVLLMDEPFGALDALTRDRMHAELESLWAATRKTVLFVTHNVREAVALGDRVLVFSPRPGRIVREFRITLPRPRRLEDYGLVDQASEILEVLHAAGGQTVTAAR